MLIETGVVYKKTWSVWVNKKEATAIPGALDFFNYAEDQGVEIIYLSNEEWKIMSQQSEFDFGWFSF